PCSKQFFGSSVNSKGGRTCYWFDPLQEQIIRMSSKIKNKIAYSVMRTNRTVIICQMEPNLAYMQVLDDSNEAAR
uniref:Uncharacterized protein n=1 Tax=Oryza brachyantha TaxID=4533 RepID=J3MNS1_ORYBR